jgi:hypothetical protein
MSLIAWIRGLFRVNNGRVQSEEAGCGEVSPEEGEKHDTDTFNRIVGLEESTQSYIKGIGDKFKELKKDLESPTGPESVV